MAATRLIAMHQNKGETIAQSLKDRVEYAKNDEKTEQGQLISSYACDKETVDEEFLLAKQEYYRIIGRKPKGDIIAYQIRQSFKPGEITPEEANKVGYETAMRFTKGNHAFIVATHTDRAHIHNHIIMNSTNLSCDGKFRDSWFIALALQKVSDLVCLEHALSVIIPRKPSERDDHSPYHRESFRSAARTKIDEIISESPNNYEEFLRLLAGAGYEIKSGKHISIRGAGQKRFIRLQSLGKGYSEGDIRKRITGDGESDQRAERPKRDFDLLIDINKKMQEGKGKGYERCAKRFNLKQISAMMAFLQDNKIKNADDLKERSDAASQKFSELSFKIKQSESRLAEISVLKKHIINYSKTREIYTQYRKAGYSKKFMEEHRESILLHKAAKQAFNELGCDKLPKVKELSEEYAKVLSEKKAAYAEYREAKEKMRHYQIAEQIYHEIMQEDKENAERQRQNEIEK
ncbi:Relaxase/Mobilisation nuclease domain-containing protein [Lachnospiraceae bacterium KH1T2]|nr:Relaxase/Mobilisation nuclease domain-containing protein [Lachnospiraceae bacterium KH1T2]